MNRLGARGNSVKNITFKGHTQPIFRLKVFVLFCLFILSTSKRVSLFCGDYMLMNNSYLFSQYFLFLIVKFFLMDKGGNYVEICVI